MKNRISIRKLIITAMFAAIVCVATMIIKVPVPATNGYIHMGDCAVILSGWMLGGAFGAAAAGIGSALADLLLAYAVYAPGTFVIKALTALTAVVFYKLLCKSNKIIARIVSAIVAEAVMVVLYFVYEATFLGYGLGAAASIPANIIQGVGGVVVAVLIMGLLGNNKFIGNIMKK